LKQTVNRLTARAAFSDELKSLGRGDLLTKPGFQPNMCRVGVLGDDSQIVSHAITDRSILSYGSARLRVMSVGQVYTLPQHRNRRYAASVMRDTLAFASEQGAHLAILFDSTNGYFEQFGFSPVFPLYRMEFDSRLAAELEQPLTLRPPKPGDIPQMAALYDRLWGGRVTLLRNPHLWVWRLIERGDRQVLVAADEEGRVHGYMAGRDFLDEQIEILAETPLAAVTILSESGRLHQNAEIETVRWLTPPDDAIVYYARQLMDVTLSAQYQLTGGWMGRMIDTKGLVATILPELTAQATATQSDFDSRKLVVDCGPDRVRIGLHGQNDSFCFLNHRDFIQILFGSLNPALGVYAGLHPDSVKLLQALFPQRVATIGCWDWY
jgi:GNAT superfamily N-acetyltransferase